MTERPYVLLSCAMSVDGCLDAPGPQRLILSGSADLDRVDGERARSDAIMVGAGTVRRDDPRLLVRSPARRAERLSQGLPQHPVAVTLTATGNLDPGAQFFTAAQGEGRPLRLVYVPSPVAEQARRRLGGLAAVVDAGEPLRLADVLADLARRGVRRLMVEGGASLGAQFLAGGLADELHLAVAPFFVGDPRAPRFAPPGSYPHGPSHPMTLAQVRHLDGIAVLRYLLAAPPDAQPPGPADGGDGHS